MIEQFSLTHPGLSGPGSNDNEGILHIPQSFRTDTLLLDAVYCHKKDTLCQWLVAYYCRGAVGVFYSPSREGRLKFGTANWLFFPQKDDDRIFSVAWCPGVKYSD